MLLRQVELDTPVHRLWAGTKLLAVAAVSLTASYRPTWAALGLVAALLVGTFLLARLPITTLPRVPWWFWAALAFGGVLTLVAGGRPLIQIAGARIGVGGLESYLLFVLFSFELVGAAALVGWTTSLGDVAPSVSVLLRPLRWLRLPVDEWAVAIALCIRCLPLLIEEARVLFAVRRLRPRPRGRRDVRRIGSEVFELLVTALSVSLRRAAEMAEAMTARGGPRAVTARVPGPRLADAVALAVVVAVCVGAWLAPAAGVS